MPATVQDAIHTSSPRAGRTMAIIPEDGLAGTAIVDTKSNYKSYSDSLHEYLEVNGLDLDDDSLLDDKHDVNATQCFMERATTVPNHQYSRACEYTLRRWIRNSRCKAENNFVRDKINTANDNVGNSTFPVIGGSELITPSIQTIAVSDEYILSALVVALKLTECLIEAERDEKMGFMNPIPLASIAPENVLIRAKRIDSQDRGAGGNTTDTDEKSSEIIEFVWIMSLVGDDPGTGSIKSRLFAMGEIFYELFSTTESIHEENALFRHQNEAASEASLNLGCNEDVDTHRPPQQSHWQSEHSSSADTISNYISKLELLGYPWSICSLIMNLLLLGDQSDTSFSRDGTYSSFKDLRLDVKRMLENPSCFLYYSAYNNPSKFTKLTFNDKMYGREHEMNQIDELYRRNLNIDKKTSNGIIISGAAGIGKSTLSKHLQTLTHQSNGFFFSAKFEKDQMGLKPLSTVVKVFDSLCDMVFMNSSQTQLTKIEKELIVAIGSDSHLLVILSSLRKLMPSSVVLEASTRNCVDSAVSMRYLFAELLRVISSHSKPITLLIDDIQYADHASLLLVAHILHSAQQTSVFFALCHRDDESSMRGAFDTWLTSISILSLGVIQLKPISLEGVNDMLSETFHVSPRISLSLSSIVYQKTMGNPLFVRQLLFSLTEQGYIYIDPKLYRWNWHLEKIAELEVSDNVLVLLMEEIQRLPQEMKFVLQVASCVGSQMTEPVIQNLSEELGLDLIVVLRQLSQKGFIIDMTGKKMFRFAHDRIHQAAYELIPDQERCTYHMRFGLALCNRTFNNYGTDNDDLFFAAVNQINLGGPNSIQDPNQRSILAELNLKAGKLSIELSDFYTAFTLLQHGLSFLGEDSWAANYRLSLDLYDLLTEVSMILHKPAAAEMYADKVIAYARCFDEKLNCLRTSAIACATAFNMEKSIGIFFQILVQLDENLPRDMGDSKVQFDIDQMTHILQSMPDDAIYNFQEAMDTKTTAVLNLYVHLAPTLLLFKPWLLGSVCLRMMELTIKTGLSSISPLVFAHFGVLCVTNEYVAVGCRIGKIALKLLERKDSLQYKSKVVYFVCGGILWTSEPLRSMVDSHLQGYKAGQRSGDIIYGLSNLLIAIITDHVAGQNLDVILKSILDFLSDLQRLGMKIFSKLAMLLLTQIMVLKEGLHMSCKPHFENMPMEGEILADAISTPSVFVYGKVYHLMRAFLYCKMEDAKLNINISDAIASNYHPLDPMIFMGYFFEGLASFRLARQLRKSRPCGVGNESLQFTEFLERGSAVLTRMRCWSEQSIWNWEEKMLLLEAESLYTLGKYDQASTLYDRAIQSAHAHKFIHTKAIACELTGTFFHEQGLQYKSYPYFVQSMKCYKEWGATAVAARIETFLKGVVLTYDEVAAIGPSTNESMMDTILQQLEHG